MTLAIIGGGPAGYVAAITAARLGREVVLIDQGPLGGTCLNKGCIPTKSLLESADMYEKVKSASEFGIDLSCDRPVIQWSAVQNRKQAIVKELIKGIGYLMDKNQIKILKGKASFLSEHDIRVEGDRKTEMIKAKQIIIATGSEPAELPFAPFDGKWLIDSSEAMNLPAIPDSLFIIGGGIIGCEFASIFSRMGTKVSLVEKAAQILPEEDLDIAEFLQAKLVETGVNVLTSAEIQELAPSRKKAILNHRGEHLEVNADLCLVAIGRKPRLRNLNLDQIGVHYDKKGIQVNDSMQTNIPHIYACGDIVGGVQLAHAAFHEGAVAASHASGKAAQVNGKVIPRCIYTSPEIASVGLNEKKARERFGHIKIGEFSFRANGKALILNEPIGKVKIITEPEYHEIVGVSIVGPDATELIGQAAVMMYAEMTAETMEDFITAHPTLSEAIHEALLQITGQAVHY
ncbi:dihydrolipoyl dehydrogenase [Bacillus changyiensis]|uniref:dihydrolipoyl dehydrogenase n=1 Tax=Bacillus changyiensis TaxID=3004103 RepID=UPI0022E446C2|nr:dihydrolipoyl dehydrogenase [Bacillus changyiensis]MDA1477249.1 dihydrolipoyl dehydrogenase [Bacillus changyiensis]